MVFKCKNCGAKLKIDKSAETIKCEYCDSVNKIDFSANDFYRKMANNSKKYTKFYLILFVIIFLFGFGYSFFMNKQLINKIPFTDNETYYGVPKYNYSNNGGYLIKNNNDEFLDIVTLAFNIEDSQNYLQIIDGKTGKRTSSIKIDKEIKSELVVINNEFIFLAKDDFTLTLYDKTNLAEIKTFLLSDKLDKYYYSDNKLFIEAYDNTKQIIDLKSLNLKKENFTKKIKRRAGKYTHKNFAISGGITYSVKKKEKSSKDIFSIIAKKDNETLWNIPLGYEDVTWWDGPVMVLTGETIITFGKKYTSDNLGYIIGIDKTDGRIVYEVQKSGKSCRLYDFYFNGRYVIANISGSFHAIEPSTGKTKWTAGNACK